LSWFLHSLRSQDPDIKGTFLPSFVNALTALAAPLVIVLDDYHVIEEPSWHDQLAFLLLYLPHLVKIALSTRTDPRFPSDACGLPAISPKSA
jgi:ATP/maltotriose-dependent transcriptional regulator MalT